MVSLILPYWDRQEAANRAITLLDETYAGWDLEVIVVDDGNVVPFVAPPNSLDLKIVRLPLKPGPTPQSRAWNAGTAAATHPIVVLSCVEVLHATPVLKTMHARFSHLPSPAYVLAAAWCPEQQSWHCHSTHRIVTCPPGTGPSFCGMLYRDTFDSVGGFDEEYHEGAGYEDKDFILRLWTAGVTFHIQDDLVVIHPKTGATIRWSQHGFQRNKGLYQRKWGSCNSAA